MSDTQDTRAPNDALAAGRKVLLTADPAQKAAAALAAFKAWREEPTSSNQTLKTPVGRDAPLPPDQPARPDKPVFCAPADVPRRRLTTKAGRFALLHAIAHIEFNAIDLAFDMATRFAPEICDLGLDGDKFVSDWYSVGADEARHFNMVRARLNDLGGDYGDLPAHNGLWEAAIDTAHSVLARLAIAPMVLEARGLDVTPGMSEKLQSVGDLESVRVLDVIYREEIGHVAAGRDWFDQICAAKSINNVQTFRSLVATHFNGPLKPPFNHEARLRAGISQNFYTGLDTTL